MPTTRAHSRGNVRIGGACAYFGDSSIASPQLVSRGAVDYLVYDYLAEVTMSILARQRAKDPSTGYAPDFVSPVLTGIVRDVAQRGIRIVSNAGGMNPRGCADALRRVAADAGVSLCIAVVEGDQVSEQLERHRADIREMFTGASLPRRLMSANAYLGALPIKAALDRGAQVVVTGRCVDSALVLGPLMHEFGWTETDYDLLAAGSIAGHILECGPQATGGVHTDWRDVPDWDDMGYPIAECAPDGSFVVTKPQGTGGLVTVGTVAEQLLYEIGDPAGYVLPDVVCDLRDVRLESLGGDRVRVSGARGTPPPDAYKVAATFQDGWRSVGRMISVGPDAPTKARLAAEMVLKRTRRLLAARGFGDYRATGVEILGTESIYGPHARVGPTREAMLRLSVEHDDRRALEVFSREMAPSSISTTPAFLGGGDAARPKVTPVVRLYSCLLPKSEVQVTVDVDGVPVPVTIPHGGAATATTRGAARAGGAPPGPPGPPEPPEPIAPTVPTAPTALAASAGDALGRSLPLLALAYARSGDKGDTANIAVIARHPALLPIIGTQLTEARVRAYFAHLVKGTVRRYEVPGVHAFNFVMTEALDGGGMASMRYDTLGKGLAQMLLDVSLEVPEPLVPYCRVDPHLPPARS